MPPAIANFLFETANFLVLAVALGWILFNPVRSALDAECERRKKRDAESERLRAEAEALAKEVHKSRSEAAVEAERHRGEAIEAAEKAAARRLADARNQQVAERAELERERAGQRAAQALALSESVGRIAAESVRRLMDDLSGPPLDLALVGAACKEIEALPPATLGNALVECARPLDQDARRQLEGVLGVGFRERVIPELGAGVRVTTEVGQVDATAAGVARHAASAVKSAVRDVEEAGGSRHA